MNERLIFLHVLSPLHAGTGQGVGVIDLPVAREKATALPFLPGSSLKGTLRDQCQDSTLQQRIFGPKTENASEHAGAVQFTDLRLLLLPVRSLAGTFAWVTSPYVLKRLKRDLEAIGVAGFPPDIPAPANEQAAFVTSDNCGIAVKSENPHVVFLEDLDLLPTASADVDLLATWIGGRAFPNDKAWQAMLKARLCVVHDDTLSFLLQTATEITARVCLDDEKKTVKEGPWYEESLPVETVLCGLVGRIREKVGVDEINGYFDQNVSGKAFQFGGKATVGRGVCRVQFGS